MSDLEKREQSRSTGTIGALAMDKSLNSLGLPAWPVAADECDSAEVWADRFIEAAEKSGYDSNSLTWESIR